MYYKDQLAPKDSPRISLHRDDPGLLHVHLPDDIAFGQGVDVPLTLSGVRQLRDMLERHVMLKSAQATLDDSVNTSPESRTAAAEALAAFRAAGNDITKLPPAPEIKRQAIEKRKRDQEHQAEERRRKNREKLEEELGISFDDIEINI